MTAGGGDSPGAAGLNLWDYMPEDLRQMFREAEVRRSGSARQALWTCEDGWIVGYTTERVVGGPFDGGFAVLAYKPTGKGARSGSPSEWQRTYGRRFSKRRLARARAEALYYRHSPRAAERHGR